RHTGSLGRLGDFTCLDDAALCAGWALSTQLSVRYSPLAKPARDESVRFIFFVALNVQLLLHQAENVLPERTDWLQQGQIILIEQATHDHAQNQGNELHQFAPLQSL